MSKRHIHHLYQLGVITEFDLKFSNFMERLSGEEGGDAQYLATVLLNHTLLNERHICLDLKHFAGKSFLKIFPDISDDDKPAFKEIYAPGLPDWLKKLQASPVVGMEGEYKPLILDSQNRLFMYRYWEYEQRLSASIKRRANLKKEHLDLVKLKKGFSEYFSNSKTDPDWQRVAAYSALTNHFCVISGGPGTGKTYTVTNIMALFLQQNINLKIAICAPTGKAAARLQESIRHTKQNMNYPDHISGCIPETASTIHRLLGVKKGSPCFFRNRENPLTADILIVDEASMISLSLLSKLVDALPERSTLILLGDKYQLSSVEAGAVLGDICDASEIGTFTNEFSLGYSNITGEKISCFDEKGTKNPFNDCIVELQHSYRFDAKPSIGMISRAVKAGNPDSAYNVLKEDDTGTLKLRPVPPRGTLLDALKQVVSDKFNRMFNAPDVREAFNVFETFQILCANRVGNNGALEINSAVESILRQKFFIPAGNRFYKGRPIIILENDYHLNLYNGDIGIFWEDEKRILRAYFPDKENKFNGLLPSRLPRHETVFAMTIHKSQGSEFENILIILPERPSPILTRELIYTGITRAKAHIEFWMNKEIFSYAVTARVDRRSGLKHKLLT